MPVGVGVNLVFVTAEANSKDQEALEEKGKEKKHNNNWDDFQRAWAMLIGGW